MVPWIGFAEANSRRAASGDPPGAGGGLRVRPASGRLRNRRASSATSRKSSSRRLRAIRSSRSPCSPAAKSVHLPARPLRLSARRTMRLRPGVFSMSPTRQVWPSRRPLERYSRHTASAWCARRRARSAAVSFMGDLQRRWARRLSGPRVGEDGLSAPRSGSLPGVKLCPGVRSGSGTQPVRPSCHREPRAHGGRISAEPKCVREVVYDSAHPPSAGRGGRNGRDWRLRGNVDDQERNSLWEDARERNSRLQQLIDAIVQLLGRSRDVLRRERPEGAEEDKSSGR